MHSENQNSLLCLLIKCISPRSAIQILNLKDECPFRFSNSLISLCNSSNNCWFEIILLLPSPPEDLLSEIFDR